MKKILFAILLSLVTFSGLKAQKIEADLGDSSFVCLLTCGPGEEFYTTWGHSALRICDSTLGLDIVYNYGTFNFNTKNFYLKFAQGKLDYCLSRTSYARFIAEYAFEGRAVWEQRLNLTRQERNNLLVLMEENYTPQYRFYKYDFFRDNCATRIRDMINNCLCHRELFVEKEVESAKTYRTLLYEPTETNLLWWRLGVDLLLGQRCDKVCTNMEYMFAPIEMMYQVDSTAFKVRNNGVETAQLDSTGNAMMILGDKRQILGQTMEPLKPSINPTLCFWGFCLVVLALTLLGMMKNMRMVWLDEILFWLVGLLSILFILMWFATDHYCTKLNWNIVWANPLFLYFAVRLRKSNIVVLIAGMLLQLVVVADMALGFLPQQLNAAIYPISIALLMRILYLTIQKKRLS